MATRFYTISRDEWQAGSYQVCAKCGARIRHVIEIDGRPFGADCGAKELGWKLNARQATNKVTDIAARADWLRRALVNKHARNLDNALTYADQLVRMAGLNYYAFEARTGWEYVEAVYASVR